MLKSQDPTLNMSPQEAEKYHLVQITKLDMDAKIRGRHGRDLKIIAISSPPSRSGYTVLTVMDMITLKADTQVYKNHEKVLVRK